MAQRLLLNSSVPWNRACVSCCLWVLVGCTGVVGNTPQANGVGPSGGLAPGVDPLRRLTKREYLNTVQDLTGFDVAAVRDLVPDDALNGGFDNSAAGQSISFLHVKAYQEVAERAADYVLSDPSRRASILGCDPDAGDRTGCLQSFSRSFGSRVLRRPLTDQEVGALASAFAAAADGEGPYDDFALLIRTLLQSPKFLLRVEVGEPVKGDKTRVRLNAYELATRLSFLLWERAPDAWLMDQAVAGILDDSEGLAQVARTMLDDPRATDALTRFTDLWFELPALERHAVDGSRVGASDAQLRDAMATEMRALDRRRALE